jgi:hypothetical protein
MKISADIATNMAVVGTLCFIQTLTVNDWPSRNG